MEGLSEGGGTCLEGHVWREESLLRGRKDERGGTRSEGGRRRDLFRGAVRSELAQVSLLGHYHDSLQNAEPSQPWPCEQQV